MKGKFLLFFLAGALFLAVGCASKKTPPQARTSPNPALNLKDANQLLEQKRCAEATEYYLKFLEKYPKDELALNSLGLAYLCDAKIDLAIETFKKALYIRPAYTDVHNNLGVAYMEKKSYPQAKAEFLKTLEDKAYPTAAPYFNLAKLAFIQGSYEEARALAKKVVDLNATLPGPRLLYALSLQRLHRTDEAILHYREVLKHAPDNLEACYYLGDILLRKNQQCEAEDFFRRVVDADPLGELGQKSIAALKTIHCTR